MARILIVEDQFDLAEALEENLEVEGHKARTAHDVATARELAEEWKPDLVILDLMLPDGSGATVLKEMRSHGFVGPVLILSAKSDERTKVRGFRDGADDYVTKPFGLLELLARVEALLRRVPQARLPEIIEFDAIEVRPLARQVFKDGQEIGLRPKEMDLLLALLERRNEAVSRRSLLIDVWGYSPRAKTRTVDWHVSELRQKIEPDPKEPTFIHTVPSVGYRFDLPTDAPKDMKAQ